MNLQKFQYSQNFSITEIYQLPGVTRIFRSAQNVLRVPKSFSKFRETFPEHPRSFVNSPGAPETSPGVLSPSSEFAKHFRSSQTIPRFAKFSRSSRRTSQKLFLRFLEMFFFFLFLHAYIFHGFTGFLRVHRTF